MRRTLWMLPILALTLALTAVTAFADCSPDPAQVYGGEEVHIYTSDFYYDDDQSLDCQLDKEYFSGVTPKWKSGSGSYVERVFYNDGDNYVTIVIKSGVSVGSERDLVGTLKIRDIDAKRTYTCKIEEGELTLGVTGKSNMESDDDKEFSLPYDYQTNKVRFVTDDGEDYGTFYGDFNDDDGDDIADLKVKVVKQSPLFLGFNTTDNTAVVKKYSNADLRFINWDDRPTFELKGTLSIYMEPEEFIYGVNDNNELYRLGGSYDSDDGTYNITTATLGSYVISDRKLTAGGTAASSSSSAASRPASSSTAYQPAPSSSAASRPASSAPQQPASSAASSSASSAAPSSSEPESSSEPLPSEPESSKPESSKPAAAAADEDKDEKDFPLVPVLLVLLAVVVVVCGVVIAGNKGGQRSRKRKFDDWDD